MWAGKQKVGLLVKCAESTLVHIFKNNQYLQYVMCAMTLLAKRILITRYSVPQVSVLITGAALCLSQRYHLGYLRALNPTGGKESKSACSA